MAVEFRGAGSAPHSSGTSISVSPANRLVPERGDVVYFALNYVASVSNAWPSAVSLPDFELLATLQQDEVGDAAEYGRLYVWRRVITRKESGVHVVSWTGGTLDGASAGLVVYSGVDNVRPNGTPVPHIDVSWANATFEIPALTTQRRNSRDLVIVANNGDTTSGASLSGWGGGLIERVDQAHNFSCLGIADAAREKDEEQAATSVTASGNGGSMALRLELFAGVPRGDGQRRRTRYGF